MVEGLFPTLENPGIILLVNDEPDTLDLLQSELEGAPFRIVLANDGVQALSHCERKAFEGILMDVNLPGLSGVETCRLIQATALNAHTPIIFLSASRINEGDLLEGLAAGCMDYLTWPYSPVVLRAKLRTMVAFARQYQALVEASRERALIEITGGALHALSQPLTSAQLLLDVWRRRSTCPSHEELNQMQVLIEDVTGIVKKFRSLKRFVPKAFGDGTILDLEGSQMEGQRPKAHH